VKLRQIMTIGAAVAALAVSVAVPASAASAAGPGLLPPAADAIAPGADGAIPAPPNMSAGKSAARSAASSICLMGHFQNVGWTYGQCVDAGQIVTVGQAGSGRALEALQVYVYGSESCFQGHVQNVGWQGWTCRADGQPALIGTVGQNRRIEAISFRVY
jgi:hypothetical protein